MPTPEQTGPHPIPGKWTNLGLLALAELLAMALWFSASAVVPQLDAEWGLSAARQAWMTMSVQLGFVAGALGSAILNVPDRFPTRQVVGLSALAGAGATAAIPLLDVGPDGALALRAVTGICLAGVYPPGMKLVATWSKVDRGLWIGVLVGALTLGSAVPHLLNAIPILGEAGMPPWRTVLLGASGMALAAGLMVLLCVRPGPYLSETAPFAWHHAGSVVSSRPIRLANFGYLGHMWELYAMWTWVPLFLIASYREAGWDIAGARVAGFGAVGIGALGCVVAGALADRIGRTATTIWSLAISGTCCLLAGLFYDSPALATVLCLVWGFAVVADSAQFSTAVSELSDPRFVGTALTMQTSLGFLLTLVTIQLIPPLVDRVGWQWVFVVLAIGPVFGIWSMYRLRQLPEARAMASGNR